MLTFYSRKNCPLCEEAKRMLELVKEDFSVDYQEIDIESDDVLNGKFMLMIPVVAREDEVLLYGNIGYADLIEALDL
ncbi:glutaredoxin family protein [Indiicoccus explosivorum]|uniref:glutaredoxin family protein n=1 Tax=Indiicoccus explosivorum TaxID=1917864 RepID=UPI000B4521F7|nr:glutaredoxin family protein [Indiicoccus explosivorum]